MSEVPLYGRPTPRSLEPPEGWCVSVFTSNPCAVMPKAEATCTLNLPVTADFAF